MKKPVLYVFAISHYCEKARWALDCLDIDYDTYFAAPGEHRQIALNLGLKVSGMPFLTSADEVIQGSAAIVSWADANAASGAGSLTPESLATECANIEQRLDNVIGVHVRRYYYSEALVDHPGSVRPIFTRDLPLLQKLKVSASWRVIRKLMIKGMDLGPAQGRESRAIVDAELRWLDGLLADGREFLVGETFSRADIAAASLLAPLVLPEQHPTYRGLAVPPNLSVDLENWSERPSLEWVRRIYARYR
jgi:glutathione S-transferase